MQKWEYKVVGGHPKEEQFNELGGAGWELVATAATGSHPFFIFRRPKQENQ